jgi:amino acid transporter
MRLRSLLHGAVAWVTAGFVALAGGVAYLVIGGTLWWWLGLAAVMPLVGLMFGRLSEEGDEWPPATGSDGPWGAP